MELMSELKQLADNLCLRSSEVNTHPVVVEMLGLFSRGSLASIGGVVERAILLQGRPYFGVRRPKGYRRGRSRECFINADKFAFHGKGVYVEGLALSPGFAKLIHHAWITTDGTDAIEVTWRHQADACHYFGIPFSCDVHARWQNRLEYWGVLDVEPEVLGELLKDTLAEPPSYSEMRSALQKIPGN
jgi:hypothetical protein